MIPLLRLFTVLLPLLALGVPAGATVLALDGAGGGAWTFRKQVTGSVGEALILCCRAGGCFRRER